MTEKPPSATSVFVRFFRIAPLVIILLLSAIGLIVFWNTDDIPTLYHHPDGHFSLNSKSGSPVSESDWKDHLRIFQSFGRARLVASDSTLLSDFGQMLNASCERGVSRYRLESGGLAFSFHVPGCGSEWDNECKTPEVIDLSGGRVKLEPSDYKFDIVILASADMQCRDLIAAASRYAEQGKSIALIAKAGSSGAMDFILLHDRKGETDMEKFIRPPGFYERHIRPHIQTLKDWFE